MSTAMSTGAAASKQREKGPPMTPEKHYAYRVGYYASATSRAIERAENAIAFLGTFPRTRVSRTSMGRGDWLAYHYFVYCTMLTATYDCALILVNMVYVMGLDPVACRNDTVRENWRVVGTQIPNRLKELEKALVKLRPVRNKFIHHLEEPNFSDAMTLFLAAELIEELGKSGLAQELSSSPAMLRKPVRDYLVRAETRDLVSRLKDELDLVVAAVVRLFEELEKPYANETAGFDLKKSILAALPSPGAGQTGALP